MSIAKRYFYAQTYPSHILFIGKYTILVVGKKRFDWEGVLKWKIIKITELY
jgi:hypothetical protein